MNVPLIGEIIALHHRKVGRANDILEQRKDEVSELVANCEQWAQLLGQMLIRADEANKTEGAASAQGVVKSQQADYLGLDYHSLREDSQLLAHLRADLRFGSFVRACEYFYEGALGLKELAYGYFEDQEGLEDALRTLRRKLSALLEAVRREGRAARTLEPQ